MGGEVSRGRFPGAGGGNDVRLGRKRSAAL
jgi:hypothetical protein